MISSIWSRLRHGLSRTRSTLTLRLRSILGGALTAETLETLEEVLITADVGVMTAAKILKRLETDAASSGCDPAWAMRSVRTTVEEILRAAHRPFALPEEKPAVVLVVGVNGVGKTTTIGKLAARYAEQRRRVLIGAADTFRAAADEQLLVWAQRARAEIVRQQHGADAAGVAYDAVAAAQHRSTDLVLIDTAGRLHTKSNLMEELRKIKRVLGKLSPTFPHHVLLVLDATTGQNALVQARQFHEAIGVTGIALTKLDSSAHGGIVIAISDELRVPIQFVGVGETLDDLQDFDPHAFTEALFDIGQD
ncbi:MAG TPA: signal recognition particle-docking protein FtsY [Candidatus Latescibacteria bacterium]|nr:signal recognition particle-docking protein FtsY [Candidatus Latescibacterota bacterium]